MAKTTCLSRSSTCSCTSLHASSYISSIITDVDLLYVCCVVYQFRCSFKYLFVLLRLHVSYTFPAIDDQVIAINFMNPCLRRLITRVLYTSILGELGPR